MDRRFIKLLLISLNGIVRLSLHKRIFIFCTTQLKDNRCMILFYFEVYKVYTLFR